MSMPLEENGSPDYCLDCIGQMSIRCTWCGGAIHVGDPITLYSPVGEFTPPEYAVVYDGGKKQAFVGCLRWDCAESGVDVCGSWSPPGKVERFPSPLEMCLQSQGMVIVPDLRKYPAEGSYSVHPVE